MDEHGFSGRKPPALEHIVPDGEERFGDGGGFDRRKAGRQRQGVAFMSDAIFGIAAANDQGHDRVGFLPARNAIAARDDRARDFKSGNVGGAGRRRIEAHTLHDVGPVDACGSDLDQDLAGARIWNRARLGFQYFRSARLLDLDDGHAFG